MLRLGGYRVLTKRHPLVLCQSVSSLVTRKNTFPDDAYKSIRIRFVGTHPEKPSRQPIPNSLRSFPPLKEIPSTVFSGTSRILSLTATLSVQGARWVVNAAWVALFDRQRAKNALHELWEMTKHELHHYWVSELVASSLPTSLSLLLRNQIITIFCVCRLAASSLSQKR
jgi:hypothetical protein